MDIKTLCEQIIRDSCGEKLELEILLGIPRANLIQWALLLNPEADLSLTPTDIVEPRGEDGGLFPHRNGTTIHRN